MLALTLFVPGMISEEEGKGDRGDVRDEGLGDSLRQVRRGI